MSAHQKKHNSFVSLFSRFQTSWRGGCTALNAFEIARNLKIEQLTDNIEQLNNLTFEGMCSHGLIAKGVTAECVRGEQVFNNEIIK
tara:strand:- start:269 stop:526 length:258 start_codon:yes stop_codon:yes gene_type:complete